MPSSSTRRSLPTAISAGLDASQSGLDMDRFNREMAAHAWPPAVREHFLGGVRSGINRTPAFFINGVRHMARPDRCALSALGDPRCGLIQDPHRQANR